MREAPLPAPFRSLAGQVRFIQKKSSTEFTSSCPKCGDQGHKGKDWPDRFIMFLDGDHSRGWCRRCGYFVWADELDDNVAPPTRAELDAWRKKQIAREEARKRSAERALAHLRNESLWERYYQQMDEAARSYWRSRGIPDSWQSWWQLGYDHNHDFRDIVSDAASIPIFGYDRKLQQIKWRLLDDAHGRYRYHLSGIPAPPFLCNPDEPLGGHVYAVEGEIKAMVTFATLDNVSCSMMGLPGVNIGEHIIAQLQQADKVTLVLDPGAKRDAVEIGRQIGLHKTWVLIPPVKIDDGIIAEGLTKRDVETVLGGAIKLDRYVTS